MKFFVTVLSLYLYLDLNFTLSLCDTIKSQSRSSRTSISMSSINNKIELHAPIGEDGEGLYSASTKGCFDVIDASTTSIIESLDFIPIPNPNERRELNIINIVSVEMVLLSEKYFNLHSLKLNIICSSK